MRLDFNVLWVDDQPERVTSQIKAISSRMQEEGFQFASKLCRTIDEVRASISDSVFTDEVDLILVDWDLGNGVHGQDVIADIRAFAPYKDIVFYSAQTAPEELRRQAFDRGAEGVYCASREQLVDEVIGVFDSLVKKVLDLDHVRGIVMGATSDIDHIVDECLLALHGKLDQPGKDAMLREILEHVQKQMAKLNGAAGELQAAQTLEDFFKARMIFTANDRLRMLARALNAPAFSQFKVYHQYVTDYQQKVVPDRNILGHVVLVPEGKPTLVTNSEGKQISLDETRQLRRQILDLRVQFRDLLVAVNGPNGLGHGAGGADASE